MHQPKRSSVAGCSFRARGLLPPAGQSGITTLVYAAAVLAPISMAHMHLQLAPCHAAMRGGLQGSQAGARSSSLQLEGLQLKEAMRCCGSECCGGRCAQRPAARVGHDAGLLWQCKQFC